MFKKSTLKLVSLLLVAVMFFSIPIPALAVSNSFSPNITDQTSTLTKPDRKAEIEVLDKKTGDTERITFYLTPGTDLERDSFQDLNSDLELQGLTIDELDDSEKEDIGVLWVDTIFDVGNFAISLAEYNANPTFWNGFWLVIDGASVVFPGIPSISGVKRMIQNSTNLKEALKIGIKRYGTLRGQSIPSECARHHIFEKRFASRLGTNENDMLAIVLKNGEHTLITAKMRGKIPYTGDGYPRITASQIINHHIDAYIELWQDTGDDQWRFLYEFAKTRQHSVKR